MNFNEKNQYLNLDSSYSDKEKKKKKECVVDCFSLLQDYTAPEGSNSSGSLWDDATIKKGVK